MQDSSLEKNMQQLMSGLEFEPDAAVWENIHRELHPEKKRRVAVWWWLAAVILLLLSWEGVFWQQSRMNRPAQPAVSVNKTQQQQSATVAGTDKVQQVQGNRESTAGTAATPGIVLPATSPTAASAITTSNTFSKPSSATDKGQPGYVANREKHSIPFHSGQNHVTDNEMDKAVEPMLLNNEPPVATASRWNTGVTTMAGADGVAVMEDNRLHLAETGQVSYPDPFTPATGIVAMPQIAKQKGTWKVYPLLGGGTGTITGGVNKSSYYSYLIPASEGVSSSLSAASPGGGTVNATFAETYASSTSAGVSLKAGFLVEKELLRRWKIQTGVQVQRLSYEVRIRYQAMQLTSFNRGASEFNYRYTLYYAAIPTLLQYRTTERLGVAVGVMHTFAVSASEGENSLSNSIRRYIPAAYVSLDIAACKIAKQQLVISPFVQYGLKGAYTGNVADKKLLQTGVQVVLHVTQ